MAAALIRRVISPALLSTFPRPVRTVAAQLLSTRFYRTRWPAPENFGDELDSDGGRIVFSSSPRSVTAKDTAEGVYVSIEMPGVNKEDVKVRVEQDHLILKGVLKKEALDNGQALYYYEADLSGFAKIPCFKLDEINAEMKSGFVQVLIPLDKEEAKKVGFDLPLREVVVTGDD